MSFVGKYERVSSENYEEFLKALDVNFMLRKAATISTPTMEVIILATLIHSAGSDYTYYTCSYTCPFVHSHFSKSRKI